MVEEYLEPNNYSDFQLNIIKWMVENQRGRGHVNQGDIADHFEKSYQTINREIKDLTQLQVVETKRGIGTSLTAQGKEVYEEFGLDEGSIYDSLEPEEDESKSPESESNESAQDDENGDIEDLADKFIPDDHEETIEREDGGIESRDLVDQEEVEVKDEADDGYEGYT